MNWLLAWSLERAGYAGEAERLQQAALAQVADGDMAEYYEPFTGEPLGSTNQSWTAAAVVDWLCRGR
jgi:glycogen debranching enzyme